MSKDNRIGLVVLLGALLALGMSAFGQQSQPAAGTKPAPADALEHANKLLELHKTLRGDADADLHKAFLQEAGQVIDALIPAHEYEMAGRLADLARQSANIIKADAASWVQKVTAIHRIEAEYNKIKPAFGRVEAGTASQEDNSQVGKFLCCFSNEWDKGLALLAKGSDDTLRFLANTETTKAQTEGLLEVADKWWDIASREVDPAKKNIKQHAAGLYENIWHLLGEVEKAKVEKKLTVMVIRHPTPATDQQEIHLFANGKVQDLDSASTWSLDKGQLVLTWKLKKGPTLVETCTFSPDGKLYICTSRFAKNGKGQVLSGSVGNLSDPLGK